MSIDRVISLGKQAHDTIDFQFWSHPIWVWGIFVVGLILIVISFATDSLEMMVTGSLVIMIFVFASLCTIHVEEHDNVSKWKKNVAIPYINSLPVEKKEVVYIKIDPELSADVRGTYNTYGKKIERTPIVVSFKDNGKVKTETNWAETTMELTKDEKPYVEFQRLTKNLGHGMNKGIYNMKVYLPNDYSFTEIK